MLPPNVSTLGLWKYLPQAASVPYVSVNKNAADNIDLTISAVCTTPRGIVEAAPAYGVYRRWATTFKIDPAVWLSAVAAYNTANMTNLTLYPKMRDRLTVNDLVWTCYDATDKPQDGSPYRLGADRLEFQADLDDQVNFVQATCSGASSTGARTVTDTVSATTIQCAIEPREQALDQEAFGTMTSPEYFDIYLTPDQTYIPDDAPSLINAGALLQDQNSVQYEILEIAKRERLDELLHCFCVKKL